MPTVDLDGASSGNKGRLHHRSCELYMYREIVNFKKNEFQREICLLYCFVCLSTHNIY